MGEDISHKTVVVLVILTLAVSIIGSLAVMNELASVKPVVINEGGSRGDLQLNIDDQGPSSDDDGGSMRIEILEPST